MRCGSGTASARSSLPFLAAYSPYHNIRAGVVYPPTLVVAGANDMRCPAWHARKFVARLQAEGTGGPFLLRVLGGGHLSTRRGADLVAEWQGFLLRELGVGGLACHPGVDAPTLGMRVTAPPKGHP